MNKNIRQILIWISIFLGLLILVNIFSNNVISKDQKLVFSDFLKHVENQEITSVKIDGKMITGSMSNGQNFSTYVPHYPNLLPVLYEKGVRIDILEPDAKTGYFLNILISWFPTILFIGIWIFFMKQMHGGSKGMGFGRSKAKLVSDKGPKITFKDVAGINEARDEVTEIVEFLRNPRKFQRIGGKIPKGCLLVGPPGTGKTLLAKAIAGEANVPFFNISGSDFVEMFVGVGASRVRDMFEQGRKNAPCIIFIDEIDAVGRHRGVGLGSGHDEREQTLNQMLVGMDGFDDNEGVVVIAATNRPDVLDKALLRPGRFDRQIFIPNPDVKGREQILKVHISNVKYSSDVDLKIIARGTPGFSGAELKNLVNEAALISARANKREVTMQALDEAKDKVMMGVERKSLAISDEQKALTAYHEAGHALVSLLVKGSDPIHKATIIPRGSALGMVQLLPEGDSVSLTLEQMKAKIAVAMGGRVAEEMTYGRDKVTSGASSDLKHATAIARSMVKDWGLDDKIGPVFYGDEEDNVYGRTKSEHSEEMTSLIDQRISFIVNEGYKTAETLLKKHKHDLQKIAETLIEKETLTGEELKKLISQSEIQDDQVKIVKKKSTRKTSISKTKQKPKDSTETSKSIIDTDIESDD